MEGERTSQRLQIGNDVIYRPLYQDRYRTSRVAYIRIYRPVLADLFLGQEKYLLVLEDGSEIAAESAQVSSVLSATA